MSDKDRIAELEAALREAKCDIRLVSKLSLPAIKQAEVEHRIRRIDAVLNKEQKG